MRTSNCFCFCLALGLLGACNPLAGQESAGTPAKLDAITAKLDKSIVLKNHSRLAWKFRMARPDTKQSAAPGTMEMWSPDFARSKVTDKMAIQDDVYYMIPPDSYRILTPVPVKTVATRLGLATRKAFSRRLEFMNFHKDVFTFTLARAAEGDKVPQLMVGAASLESILDDTTEATARLRSTFGISILPDSKAMVVVLEGQ